MAQDQLAPATLLEESEIPVYVVRPTEHRNRYPVAPRIGAPAWETRRAARGSLWQRVKQAWQNRRADTVSQITPLPAASSFELSTTVRYEATLQTPAAAPVGAAVARKLQLAAAALAIFVGALAWGLAQPSQRPANASQAPLAGAISASAAKHAKAETPAEAAAPVKAEPAAKAAPVPAAETRTAAKAAPPARRTRAVDYVVKRGDSFSSIGAKYKLTPRTVRIVNDLPLGAALQPGQKLVIPPVDGDYHRVKAGETLWVIARRYGTTGAAITRASPGLNPSRLQPGQRVLIPGFQGINGADGTTAAKPAAAKPAAKAAVAAPARNTRVAKRIQASRSLAGAFGSRVGALAWPASGQVSSNFGARGRSFHPGVDISNYVGTTIRAAKAGKVLSAGWNGAYGYAVDIDHGGGVVTRYGHCSKLLVGAGDAVVAGQQIAAMGSTGRSTGPHVHFEVRINGRPVNPATFL